MNTQRQSNGIPCLKATSIESIPTIMINGKLNFLKKRKSTNLDSKYQYININSKPYEN